MCGFATDLCCVFLKAILFSETERKNNVHNSPVKVTKMLKRFLSMFLKLDVFDFAVIFTRLYADGWLKLFTLQQLNQN